MLTDEDRKILWDADRGSLDAPMRAIIRMGVAANDGRSREETFGDVMLEILRTAYLVGVQRGFELGGSQGVTARSSTLDVSISTEAHPADRARVRRIRPELELFSDAEIDAIIESARAG